MGIIEKLKKADKLYYAGKPNICDHEYDTLRRLAKKKYPNDPYFKTVGAVIPGTVKVQHEMPMGSLDNVLTREEFDKWYMNVVKKYKGGKLCLQYKLDGASVELIYVGGQFH